MKHFYAHTTVLFHCCLLGLAIGGLTFSANAQSFSNPTIYQASSGTFSDPEYVALGDMNADGRLDIVVADRTDGKVGVLAGQANGFAPVVPYLVKADVSIFDLALGDVSGDGILDIVTAFGTYAVQAGSTIGSIGVQLGLATGGFAPTTIYGPSNAANYVASVALGDVNNDGRMDIVGSTSTGGIILLGQASGFASAISIPMLKNLPTGRIALGDFNQDGRLDLATASGVNNVAVLLSQANSYFSSAATYKLGDQVLPERITLGDVDADGHLDILTANVNNNTVSVLKGQAAGTFGTPSTYASGTPFKNSFALQDAKLGDVNGDGRLDIITTISISLNSTGIGVLLGQANGFGAAKTFVANNSTYAAYQPSSLVMGDVDKDGRVDAVTVLFDSNQVSVLRNMSTPLATIPSQSIAAAINTFPNPAHGDVTISSAFKLEELTLYNSIGQSVLHKRVDNSADLRLNILGLSPGLYSLRIQGEGQFLIKQIQVE